MGVYKGLVRLRKRGLLASITFLVHCREWENGQKDIRFAVSLVGLITAADRQISTDCLWTYSGDVIRRLSQCLKDVNRRRKVDILEVMQRIRVSSRILLLLHILNHLCFKFCANRARLNQWQSVERDTEKRRDMRRLELIRLEFINPLNTQAQIDCCVFKLKQMDYLFHSTLAMNLYQRFSIIYNSAELSDCSENRKTQ